MSQVELIRHTGAEVALFGWVLRIRCHSDSVAESLGGIFQGYDPHQYTTTSRLAWLLLYRSIDSAYRLCAIDYACALQTESGAPANRWGALSVLADLVANQGDSVAQIPKVFRFFDQGGPDLVIDIANIEGIANIPGGKVASVLAIPRGNLLS